MARIRTIKPDFFRHEELQRMESENPGCYGMIVFVGLWTLADKNGVFLLRPRQIKLDILPFLNFEMEKTLELLARYGFIRFYENDGKEYGHILTFTDHQRITGKEAQDGQRYPLPTDSGSKETTVKQQGNTGDQPVVQEKEKEKEKENITDIPAKKPAGDKKPDSEKPVEKPICNPWAIWVDANRDAGRLDPLPVGKDTKAGKEIGKLLKGDKEKLEAIFRAFLSDTDDFLISNGHALSFLPARINKYLNATPEEEDGYGLTDAQISEAIAYEDRLAAQMGAEAYNEKFCRGKKQ